MLIHVFPTLYLSQKFSRISSSKRSHLIFLCLKAELLQKSYTELHENVTRDEAFGVHLDQKMFGRIIYQLET